MKVARWLALAGCLAMALALIYGFTVGDFNGDGAVLLGLIWGKITMLDIYLSFALFCGWVIYRERSPWAAAWVLGVIGLGSFACCLYTYMALTGARGDWRRFWLGRRA